ncbi:MAG: ATP phosphoribosyltransferase regulatory subunit [Christensenellaceae bacterium]|nr:ATP phosphoribosyltransferase regulatory subunit [Christensenellaceae bacterium]
MADRRLQIPSGMQDTLPGECARKRGLELEFRRLFALRGYQEVETPILEYYDALDDATWGYRPEHLWKTFDGKGRILAVRPDSTIPAVRLAAGRLGDSPLPLRLCYVQSATKLRYDTLSMLCEETQCGVELMGEGSAQADAECIALAIEALRLAGLRDFQVELGQAGFFAGFMQEAGLDERQCAAVRELTEQKNALGIQLYLEKLAVSKDVAVRLQRLPMLYGGPDVLDEAEALTAHPLCRAAVRNLRDIMALLEAYGCADCVSIDLGMTHQANYYSGMIFRGMTAELGQPLLSGGRYDGLPARYGREMPATGFALSMKLLMIALERQGAAFTAPVPDVLLAFDPACLEQAIAWAEEQRENGRSVAMVYGATEAALQQRLNAGLARSAVYIGPEGIRCCEGG